MKLFVIFVIALIMHSCIQPTKEEKLITYLALGDSYTIGESVTEKQRFPVQLNMKLRKAGIKMDSVKIVATTGWTTDELAAGIKSEHLDEKYKLVTLLIGVNNQFRGRDTAEYRAQFTELLTTAIGFASGNPEQVIVVSIPDYGVTPFAKERNPVKIAEEIDFFNKINREETQRNGAHYVNITPISKLAKTDLSLLAEDGLHPSGKMYALWVEKIFPVAKQIVQDTT